MFINGFSFVFYFSLRKIACFNTPMQLSKEYGFGTRNRIEITVLCGFTKLWMCYHVFHFWMMKVETILSYSALWSYILYLSFQYCRCCYNFNVKNLQSINTIFVCWIWYIVIMCSRCFLCDSKLPISKGVRSVCHLHNNVHSIVT